MWAGHCSCTHSNTSSTVQDDTRLDRPIAPRQHQQHAMGDRKHRHGRRRGQRGPLETPVGIAGGQLGFSQLLVTLTWFLKGGRLVWLQILQVFLIVIGLAIIFHYPTELKRSQIGEETVGRVLNCHEKWLWISIFFWVNRFFNLAVVSCLSFYLVIRIPSCTTDRRALQFSFHSRWSNDNKGFLLLVSSILLTLTYCGKVVVL